jgi:hypothetical protein
MLAEGREIFRYGSFGSEDFWGESSSCTKPFSVRSRAASVQD